MKIQKQISDKRGDKIYYKYVIVLPKEILKKSRLKAGDGLDIETSKDKIILKKKS